MGNRKKYLRSETAVFRTVESAFRPLKKRYGAIRFEWMDMTVMAYLGILGILVIPFHRDVRNWAWIPVIHAGVIFVLLEFLRFEAKHPHPVLHFIRTFYPAFGITFLWMELNRLVTMILPYWANAFVVGLDLRLFGVHPTVWVERLFHPWLTELMNFFYSFYFLFIPMVGFVLYFRNKRQETFDFLFLVMLTFCSCFLLFLVFPAEGAWVVLKNLHHVQPEGGFFMHLNQSIQARGTIRGGAFPSSHVAAALVIALAALRTERKLGLFLLPFAFGVVLATVYCRYHHAVDSLAGLLWGLVCYGVGVRLMARRKDRKGP
ncbi:MAG TPA: phosphatase PAP2 family protein [bacterium]